MLISCGVLLADQASKTWALAALGGGKRIALVDEALQLRLVRNSGSAFGLFSGAGFFLFCLNLLILIAVLIWAFRSPELSVPLGLVVGGGAGNLADRLLRGSGVGRGEVVDFIYLSFWPTFNVADAAIVLGVALMFAGSLRERA